MGKYILGSGLVIPEKCFKCPYDALERFKKCSGCKFGGIENEQM